MSFSEKVKNEIAKMELGKICCARAELAGMICFAGETGTDFLKFSCENSEITYRFLDIVRYIYKIKAEITSNEKVYTATVSGDNALKILRDVKLASVPMRISHLLLENDCCFYSFLRGAFLGRGTVVSPEKSYHMEFILKRYSLVEDFSKLIERTGITPKYVKRNGRYVFYIKGGENIEMLLGVLGAHVQMMELLNVKIEKGINNKINRRMNCDMANSDKIANTAVEQEKAILIIKNSIGLTELPEQLRDIALLRLENTGISLSGLAATLGISKSGANHRMRKLMNLAAEIKEREKNEGKK